MSNDKETNGKLLTGEEAEALSNIHEFIVKHREKGDRALLAFGTMCAKHQAIPALLADRKERIERNAKGIEIMFAKMNKLDTPKRGELHLLLIALFS